MINNTRNNQTETINKANNSLEYFEILLMEEKDFYWNCLACGWETVSMSNVKIS